MGKVLFLLTKTYPFGIWEQYITAELDYLSKVFDKIIIYPNDYYDAETEHPKKLPDNVEILNFNQQLKNSTYNSIGDYGYLMKQTIIEFFSTDDKSNFIKNFKWNLVNFWTQYKLAKLFSEYLQRNNYKAGNCLFYSYWFHKSAIFLSVLKDKDKIRKAVSRSHSIDLYHNDWGLINEKIKVPSFKMFKLKHIDEIYTVSKHGENYLKNKYPDFSNKISTKNLSISVSEENYKKIPQNRFHIVTCSDIDENKRLHKLAEALMKINKDILWTHFGSGKLLTRIEKLAESFPETVEFRFMGRTPNKDVKEFYAKNEINLFINLSVVEGLPVSIMEAMGYHIPIIATSVYGTPEAVINNKNGFLLDVNFETNELVDLLNYCIENKEKLTEMGEASHEIYLEKFEAEKNYTLFANYLASL